MPKENDRHHRYYRQAQRTRLRAENKMQNDSDECILVPREDGAILVGMSLNTTSIKVEHTEIIKNIGLMDSEDEEVADDDEQQQLLNAETQIKTEPECDCNAATVEEQHNDTMDGIDDVDNSHSDTVKSETSCGIVNMTIYEEEKKAFMQMSESDEEPAPVDVPIVVEPMSEEEARKIRKTSFLALGHDDRMFALFESMSDVIKEVKAIRVQLSYVKIVTEKTREMSGVKSAVKGGSQVSNVVVSDGVGSGSELYVCNSLEELVDYSEEKLKNSEERQKKATRDMLAVGGTSVHNATTKVMRLVISKTLARTLNLDGTGKGKKGVQLKDDESAKLGFSLQCPFLYRFIMGEVANLFKNEKTPEARANSCRKSMSKYLSNSETYYNKKVAGAKAKKTNYPVTMTNAPNASVTSSNTGHSNSLVTPVRPTQPSGQKRLTNIYRPYNNVDGQRQIQNTGDANDGQTGILNTGDSQIDSTGQHTINNTGQHTGLPTQPHIFNTGYSRRPEIPNTGLPTQPHIVNTGYSRRPEIPNTGLPTQPHIVNTGYARQPEIPNTGLPTQPNIVNTGYSRQPKIPNTGHSEYNHLQSDGHSQPAGYTQQEIQQNANPQQIHGMTGYYEHNYGHS